MSWLLLTIASAFLLGFYDYFKKLALHDNAVLPVLFVDFTAIAQPEALISLISPVRRSSVVISFLLGIFLFRETHRRAKGTCIAGIITGVILLS